MPRKGRTTARQAPARSKGTARRQPVEVAVHTSLPPLVRGALKGHLRVCVCEVLWGYSVGPPTSKLCARLKWWGEKSAGTVFRVSVRPSTGSEAVEEWPAVAYYPVRAGLAQLKAYLKDMGGLTFELGLGHMTDDSMVIGQCHVPVMAALLPASTIKGLYPITNANGTQLGQLRVSLRFEMACGNLQAHDRATPPEFVVGPGAVGKHSSPPVLPTQQLVRAAFEKTGQSATTKAEAVGKRSQRKDCKTHLHHHQQQQQQQQQQLRGSQQLEVISELIDRGRKLRDAMVESVAGTHTGKENEPPPPAATSRAQQPGSSSAIRGVVDLVLMEDDSKEPFLYDLSSDDGDALVGDDFSMNESDYPLYSGSLLQDLLYSEEPAALPAVGEGGSEQEPTPTAEAKPRQDKADSEAILHNPSNVEPPPAVNVDPPVAPPTSEPALHEATPPSSQALQLLVLIPQGTAILPPLLPHQASRAAGSLPNCYLVCRLFCCPSPHPRSTVQWATAEPHFAFKQVYTLHLTPSLLKQVCNNFTVVEVWHRTPGTRGNAQDELIGLVKVSLHQFYLAYSDPASAQLCMQAQLPVVAMDSYCPIVDPLSGAQCGYLALMLAMGSIKQVAALQQQFASGAYALQPPYTGPSDRRRQRPLRSTDPEPEEEQVKALQQGSSKEIRHMFEVGVAGVRGVAAFASTVWGEADCFVQYHFPATAPAASEDSTVDTGLTVHRTETTLCVPDPSLSYQASHALFLPPSRPLQGELLAVCGSGGGVTFELWKRYYYPNIRDQLVAKALLPIAKLCALVSMQQRTAAGGGGGGANVQSFALPLKLISGVKKVKEVTEVSSSREGLLDITVSYEATSQSNSTEVEPSRVLPSLSPALIQPAAAASPEHHDDESSGRSSEEEEEEEEEEEKAKSKTPPAESFKDMFEARVVIHQALHLPVGPPSAFVTLHPHPSVEKISTAVVCGSQSPLWSHQCTTHIPNLYLEPQCPGLEFQVWSEKGAESEAAAGDGGSDSSYLGSAHIDMSPLSYGLGQICGWYNIVDFGGEIQGQLKVSIVPSLRISFPSALLSLPVHVSSSVLSKSRDLPPGATLPLLEWRRKGGSAIDHASSTTSILIKQLRENITELDKIHQTLQAKLYHADQESHNTEEEEEEGGRPLGVIASPPSAPLVHSMQHEELHSQVLPWPHPEGSADSSPPPQNSTVVNHTTELGGSLQPNLDSALPPGAQLVTTIVLNEEAQCSLSQGEDSQTSREATISESQDDDLGTLPLETSSVCSTGSVEGGAHCSAGSLTDVSPAETSNDEELSQPTDDLEKDTHSEPSVPELQQTRPQTEPALTETEESWHTSPHASPGLKRKAEETHTTLVRRDSNESTAKTLLLIKPHEKVTEPKGEDEIAGTSLPEREDPSQVASPLPHPGFAKEGATFVESGDVLHPVSTELPEAHLPNFFMPPQQLEQTMRLLRAGALSHRPLQMLQHRDSSGNEATLSPHTPATSTSTDTGGCKDTLQSLKEVAKHLEMRRRRKGGGTLAASAADTQRIARIFSSTAHAHCN